MPSVDVSKNLNGGTTEEANEIDRLLAIRESKILELTDFKFDIVDKKTLSTSLLLGYC